MSFQKQILVNIVLLLGTICLFEFTNLDLAIQDHFYLRDCHQWMIDKRDPVLKLIFYTGIKDLIIAFGTLCFFCWLLSYKVWKLARYRRFCVLICLALIIVPVTISILKNISNVYTPNKIGRYGGDKPYVKVLERYPPRFEQSRKGKGWPAGHASGGFALMMLYYAFTRKKFRILGVSIGLTLGWTMGLYQMLKGAHYLSHTIVTMFIAWILIIIIYRVTRVDFRVHIFTTMIRKNKIRPAN
ncbi:MAG: phosphatase PAP2 family protein [Desulfobacterales bacterium]|nr:phosphatase PAP2 family protein [Desulfobacterales bacterium]